MMYLIAAGISPPAWIKEGIQTYQQRLLPAYHYQLLEIETAKRGKNTSVNQALQQEGSRMLAKIPSKSWIVALDSRGSSWTTEQFAKKLQYWLTFGKPISFLIGGPDGLAPECLAQADQKWSLSPLTFPHMIVRLLFAEQLYRASAWLEGHPYHR